MPVGAGEIIDARPSQGIVGPVKAHYRQAINNVGYLVRFIKSNIQVITIAGLVCPVGDYSRCICYDPEVGS
ncbi:hypothetical protein LDC_0715 [sediment metagenome]|uniref:Uncharacterized protein n=1 Tax=sediment metagenome TaxID=749907 RepID=D9PGR8_9ZZZZ